MAKQCAIQTGKCSCCHITDPSPSEKRKEYNSAVKVRKLLEKGTGLEWHIRMWHNIRWHWDVQALDGKLSIHTTRSLEGYSYWALFSLTFPGAGDPRFELRYSSNDPVDVARNQLKHVVSVLTTETSIALDVLETIDKSGALNI